MTTTAFDLATRKLFDGRHYTVSHNEDLAGDGTASVVIENPSDSGTEAFLFVATISHEVETEVAIYSDVDSISGGSSEDIAEDNIGGSKPSEMVSTTNSTFTTDDEHERIVYVGEGQHALLEQSGKVVQPGHNIVVELTNLGSSNSQIGIKMSWVEKPK